MITTEEHVQDVARWALPKYYDAYTSTEIRPFHLSIFRHCCGECYEIYTELRLLSWTACTPCISSSMNGLIDILNLMQRE